MDLRCSMWTGGLKAFLYSNVVALINYVWSPDEGCCVTSDICMGNCTYLFDCLTMIFSYWAWPVCHDLFPQFWAVLYKLLQREVAAAFHPVDTQGRARRIWSGRHWSKSMTKRDVFHTNWCSVGFHSYCFFYVSLFQWEPVQFFNNKIICDLVEEKHRGIISILVCIHSEGTVYWTDTEADVLRCDADNPAGWGVSQARRCHRSYFPGKTGRKDVQSPSLCHVSLKLTSTKHADLTQTCGKFQMKGSLHGQYICFNYISALSKLYGVIQSFSSTCNFVYQTLCWLVTRGWADLEERRRIKSVKPSALHHSVSLHLFDYRHKLADKMTRKTLERGDFRLLHYAGEVTYCVVGKGNHNVRHCYSNINLFSSTD